MLVRDLIARERTGARVVVVGFSQGAMLAVDVAFTLRPSPDAVVVGSGALLGRARLEPWFEASREVRVLVAHGRRDPIVPFLAGEVLRDALVGAGVRVRFVAFDGGHETTPDVVEDVERFVYELAGDASTS
jgi:phospholipase/carboxylesterase